MFIVQQMLKVFFHSKKNNFSTLVAGYNIRRSWKLFEEAREMIESGKKASLEFVMDPRVEVPLKDVVCFLSF